MEINKKELIQALTTNAQALRQGMDKHCSLVASLVENGDDPDLAAILEWCPRRSREKELKAAITEAIGVLEQSRKAFKSKQLEKLRKKLTQVLIDMD